MRERRGIGPFLAVLAALAGSVAFAVWAYAGAAGTECIVTTTGIESCRSTPLAHGLGRELIAVLAPSLVCGVVWVLLHRYCTRGNRLALGGAAMLTALFTLFSVLALLSIGALLMPIALLLGFAVAATEPPRSPSLPA